MKANLLLVLVFFSLLATCSGQQNAKWSKCAWLIGEWMGEGAGQPGKGDGVFSFRTDLDSSILVRKSHSEYPSQGDRPKIVHDDLMIVYPDSQGISAKAIYFDNEGHTINYQVSFSEKSIIFTSDKTLSTPIFRLTYTLLDNEIVNTKFEISTDKETFTTYIEGKSVKAKQQAK
ncbi:MAG: hypothetical protein WCI92_15500 [Bacteroidota bacterium]